jgi:hypothetical protein
MELPVKGGGGLRIKIKAGKHTNIALTIPYWMGPVLRSPLSKTPNAEQCDGS